MGAIGYGLLIASTALVAAIAICSPLHLGDQNPVIRVLINDQILNILGVIIAIFLPSAANLYIRLAELEVLTKKSLSRYRDIIKFNCNELIALFILTVIALPIKGGNAEIPWLVAVVNGGALVVLLANVLALADLTRAMFDVGEVSARQPPNSSGGKQAS